MPEKADVILIDDDPCTLVLADRTVKSILSEVQTATFCRAGDALKYLLGASSRSDGQTSSRGIVLCDLHMPGMTGFEFLDEFAKLPDAVRNLYNVYIVSSTMDSDEKSRLAAKSTFAGFCPKPLTPEKFQRLLTEDKNVALR